MREWHIVKAIKSMLERVYEWTRKLDYSKDASSSTWAVTLLYHMRMDRLLSANMVTCFCSLWNSLMIYSQSALRGCEKSLTPSYSIFKGTQKNNFKVVRTVSKWKVFLRRKTVINVVNISQKWMLYAGNVIVHAVRLRICLVFLPLLLFGKSAALVYIAA